MGVSIPNSPHPTSEAASLTVLLVSSWNWSKGRQVYGIVMDRGMKVHRSVKIRMLARGPEGDNKPYVPKVRCTIHGKPRTLTREEWLADEPRYFVWTD